ncbi:hypothetical protein [Aeromicrobium sp. Leaf350]|uniref:variant leucine-rich repeat-containing protein n=1 Tax=Aeromicrobium sp. Leaf350 TaxID=2876565 RepID=UPI001E4F7341|nr:hypothetical protein [Aeromicrobium sp. Leaf350]
MATDETRAEASNPGTPAARLQELTNDPELWPLIAANPNAYDSLLAWLGENGGPDVQSAIASRGGAAEPTSVLPQQAPPVTPPPGGPGLPPPGGSALPPPGGYNQAPAGFPPPGGPQGGSGGSKKGLWITLAVLVFLLVGSGIGVGVWALTKDDDSDTRSDEDTSDTDPTDDPSDEPSDDTDDDDTSGDIDCDALDDVSDAGFDIVYYIPDVDDQSTLDDAVAVLEDFEGTDDADVTDAIELILSFASTVQDDPDAAFGDEFLEASDALGDIDDFIFEEC